MPEVHDEKALQVASFRHRIIASAIDADEESIAGILTSQAGTTHIDPQGRTQTFSVRTLWRWLSAYRRGGILSLCRKSRKDRGSVRAFETDAFEKAKQLRRENHSRPTKTVIDILVRQHRVAPSEIARSTLDRHFAKAGLSRLTLHSLGAQTFRLIETTAPFQLVVGDFHHGPYVRVPQDGSLRRALMGAHIDHFSRYVPEGRYFLHEDFVALRYGFRRLVTGFGTMQKYYADNGPSYQATRFHAACDALGIKMVHSKPYKSECRGVIERWNRTLKDQFESEVKQRDEPLTLDELNGYFEAWLAERYHDDIHSETGEPPRERFRRTAVLQPAPDLATVDELLRLRERRTVHKKWSTVEVCARRYLVDSSLRGRRVDALHDPFAPEYVLIVLDGRVVQRAFEQKPGEVPPQTTPLKEQGPRTDYLALLRADYDKRTHAELGALRLRTVPAAPELSLADLLALLQACRGTPLGQKEHTQAAALWRKMRPIDAEAARTALDAAKRRLGTTLHLGVYLDALTAHLVRSRTKGASKP
jgi:hypothetical protein